MRVGSTGMDRTLVISPAEPGSAYSAGQVPRACNDVALAARAFRTHIDMNTIDISVVDHIPEELLAVHLLGLHCEYDLNVGTGARFTYLSVKLGKLQVRPGLIWLSFD